MKTHTLPALSIAALCGAASLFSVAALAGGDGGKIQCGTTVTTSIKLKNDLYCPGGDGLIVEAPGITIDLNGHTIRGGGTGKRGIFKSSSIKGGANIKNGRITGFGAGISLATGEEPENNVVENLALNANVIGLESISSATLRTVKIYNNKEYGIFSQHSKLSIEHSDVTGNPTGIRSASDSIINIKHSRILLNGTGYIVNEGQPSIITDSEIAYNGTGITQSISFMGSVERNWIHNNRVGMHHDNFIDSNGPSRIVGNIFANNLVGLSFDSLGAVNITFKGVLIKDNVFRSNGSAGLMITVATITDGGVISENWFTANGFAPRDNVDPATGLVIKDGLYINIHAGRPGKVTVQDNIATRNAGYGINAVAGVIDGGGDIAFGNGNPDQCYGVNCSRSGR